ncbi:MAG: RdgB/HAM1 family non-canonical purine NTP pyrophosphatase [Wolinella sp.]
MKILVATSNSHKLREISEIFANHDVMSFGEILSPFEIIEDGTSFKENAIIKARAIFSRLSKDEQAKYAVISDDSGICVDVLKGAPGIFSARYAGETTSDEENLNKLIAQLKACGADSSKAHYVAAIALIIDGHEFTTHGFLHGEVITIPRGSGGFGYDPIFIPCGESRTLAEMSPAEKNAISHRANGLQLANLLMR